VGATFLLRPLQKFGFDRVDDIQVLSPMQRGVLGCRNLNTVLQETLNPTGPAIPAVRMDLPRGRQGHADGQ